MQTPHIFIGKETPNCYKNYIFIPQFIMPAKEKFLKDYRPLEYFIKEVHLTFLLDPQETVVHSKMKVNRNRDLPYTSKSLELDGSHLKLLSIFIDGRRLEEGEYEIREHSLYIKHIPEDCVLETTCQISPIENTQLEGLYLSSHFFCTQNEPEGFRHITYFLDRPDNMALFTTKIVADKKYRYLLSNGNLIEEGEEGDSHFAVWQDPFLKPSYLFALVAGDFGLIEDAFITMSNREVQLKIFCEKGDEPKCHFAMQSLKKAMKWDEEVFHLEYDLDIFMIVATPFFNMGAMENKGLNIFNSVAILADKETTTDEGFLYVERVIAHEYFHNWTGNRITCRDWFQLTLKEGLTIYRDQEFSADLRSRPLKRIDNALNLQTLQFAEDRGPTSHPIQPQSYLEINNFYTKTVYEKGSEVIRMIATLIGKEKFMAGMERYFSLYDSMAVTTEEFVSAMESASHADLTQFRRWYTQNGTPEIHIEYTYEEKTKKLTLYIRQSCHPLVKACDLKPFHFPLIVGLVSLRGEEIKALCASGRPVEEGTLLEIKKEKETFVFEEVTSEVIVSVNRNFSAPLLVHLPYDKRDYFLMMRSEKDPFNRFQCCQDIANGLMQEGIGALIEEQEFRIDHRYLHAYVDILKETSLDPGFKARLLRLPSETDLLGKQKVYQFEETHAIYERFMYTIAKEFEQDFRNVLSLIKEEPYLLSNEKIGERSLKNLCLEFLSYLSHADIATLIFHQYKNADNMTDRYGALSLIVSVQSPYQEEVLEDFFHRYQHDDLVMMKWFAVQASSPLETTYKRVKELLQHPSFNPKLPNIVRSLLGTFIENHAIFHNEENDCYPFLAEQILYFDKINPSVAARLSSAFKKYPRMPSPLKKKMGHVIDSLLSHSLSTNVYEILTKSFNA